MCSAKRGEFVNSFVSCHGKGFVREAESAASNLDRKLRSQILGKIVAARAVMRKQQLEQQQPKPQPPVQRPKRDI